MKNYYKILEVDENASREDIKAAYRRLARIYHPDKNGDEELFKEINTAYSILNNDLSKRKYDSQLNNTIDNDFANNFTNSHYNPNSYFNSDIFNEFWNNAHNIKERDVNLNVFISLKDVILGCERTLNISADESETIKIKKGARNDQTITYKDKGIKGENSNGNLKITIRYIKDDIYKVVGNDIHVNVNVDMYTAILGGIITLNTLVGELKVDVPPNTQYGNKLRINGKGLPVYENTRKIGDLILTINIVLPSDLTDEEIRLFNHLKNLRKNEDT